MRHKNRRRARDLLDILDVVEKGNARAGEVREERETRRETRRDEEREERSFLTRHWFSERTDYLLHSLAARRFIGVVEQRTAEERAQLDLFCCLQSR